MENEFLNERNSAPTGADETVDEMKLGASDPLGVAACSASSFVDEPFMVDGKMYEYLKTGSAGEEQRKNLKSCPCCNQSLNSSSSDHKI